MYELMEGGSLEDKLFVCPPDTTHTLTQHPVILLPWQDRVRVAAEVVSALVYLHTATPSIVHM